MDQSLEEPRPRTPYELLGGEAGVRTLVDAFYDAMDADPAATGIRRMHADDLSPMRVRLADWLSGWMGGPAVYAARHPGRPCVMAAHAPFPIGAAEARQWMACMRQALDRTGVSGALRKLLDAAFARMCEAMSGK